MFYFSLFSVNIECIINEKQNSVTNYQRKTTSEKYCPTSKL